MTQASTLACLLIGLGLGWLTGLSVSPVTQSVIGALLASAGTLVAALSGIRSEQTAKITVNPWTLVALVPGRVGVCADRGHRQNTQLARRRAKEPNVPHDGHCCAGKPCSIGSFVRGSHCNGLRADPGSDSRRARYQICDLGRSSPSCNWQTASQRCQLPAGNADASVFQEIGYSRKLRSSCEGSAARIAAAALSLVLMLSAHAVAQTPAKQVENLNAGPVYLIQARRCPGAHALTGFVPGAYIGILTALHGVVGCGQIDASGPGGPFHLHIATVDVTRDLALLVPDDPEQSARLEAQRRQGRPSGSVSGLKLGDMVHFYGFPGGYGYVDGGTLFVVSPDETIRKKVPAGKISSMPSTPARALSSIALFWRSRGLSALATTGAPIVNLQGQIVAVAIGGMKDFDKAWAIPILGLGR